jgi:hypothetical protein
MCWHINVDHKESFEQEKKGVFVAHIQNNVSMLALSHFLVIQNQNINTFFSHCEYALRGIATSRQPLTEQVLLGAIRIASSPRPQGCMGSSFPEWYTLWWQLFLDI